MFHSFMVFRFCTFMVSNKFVFLRVKVYLFFNKALIFN